MTDQEKQKIIEAIKDEKFTHARTRGWCRVMLTYIYHRDSASPSGVILAATGEAEEVDPLIRQYRNTSPLSSTEGLGR